MTRHICAGMHILYKENGQWKPGILQEGDAIIDDKGLALPIVGKESYVDLDDLFLDSFAIDEAIKAYKEYFMTKTEYITYIESDDFNRQLENAFVSDGEYGYYPVSKFTKNWLEKQPFEYIVRSNY